jgi:alpha-D-ribose 1-methylphosphonate 5-triphosphate synthase subunit PhnG
MARIVAGKKLAAMNAERFETGARVVLREDQKALPFWKGDRFREGVGVVLREPRHGLQMVRMHRGNWTKVFFLKPETLSRCETKSP